MCFHTRDAVERNDSSFTFEMPNHRLRTPAAKVALASCEFPMVQWTLEPSFNRFYFNEGVRISDPSMQKLLVAVKNVDRPGELCVAVHLPLRLNPVETSTTTSGGRARFTFVHPHGLLSGYRGGDVAPPRMIGGRGGDVVLSPDVDWRVIDAKTIELPSALQARQATMLHTPTLPTMDAACRVLNNALRDKELEEDGGVRIGVTYDPASDRVTFAVDALRDEIFVRIYPTPLAEALGVSTTLVRAAPGATARVPSLPSTGFWDYVELPAGFYGPCHRPMCTGAPLRFHSEFECAVNRLYFPIEDDKRKQHMLVFNDPDGRPLTAVIPSGRYTPPTFCAHLEEAMTRAARVERPDVDFSVSHEDDRFAISCESTRDGRVTSVAFGLMFHHPLCLDARRLGFSTQPLSGSSTYVAPHATHFARVERAGESPRFASNVVRVSDVPGQKRFSLHASATPLMVAVAESRTSDVVSVRTRVNGVPFAHGFQVGDVVSVASIGREEEEEEATEDDDGADDADGADRGGGRTRRRRSVARIPLECSCVVVETAQFAVDRLSLRAPSGLSGIGLEGTSFYVRAHAEPWNVCFGKANGVPAHALGFRDGVVQWGVDGSVTNDRGQRMPPFEAPCVHSLDHPDYVLLTLSESSGQSLTHSFDGENKNVFCKLSLYPLFREERMLPRDTSLLHNKLGRFTLAFWNPDLRTPYHFHGVNFSFSLNFVSWVPDT